MGLKGPRVATVFDANVGRRATRRIVDDLGKEAVARTAELTPRSEPLEGEDDNPRHLADSWTQARTRRAGDVYTTGAQTRVAYAPFVEYDTRPHIIRARPGATLAFRGASGHTIFAASVQHPGTTGAHMALRGAVAASEALPRIARPHIEQMRRELEDNARRDRERRR